MSDVYNTYNNERDPLQLLGCSDADFSARLARLSFYSLLRVNRNSPTRVILTAFRTLSPLYHHEVPRNREYANRQRLVEITLRLSQAKTTLSDEDSRTTYDATLDADPDNNENDETVTDLSSLLTGNEPADVDFRRKFNEALSAQTRDPVMIIDNSTQFSVKISTECWGGKTMPWMADLLQRAIKPSADDLTSEESKRETFNFLGFDLNFKTRIQGIINNPATASSAMVALFALELSSSQISTLILGLTDGSGQELSFPHNVGSMAAVMERYETTQDSSLGYWAHAAYLVRALVHAQLQYAMLAVEDLERALLCYHNDEDGLVAKNVAAIILTQKLITRSMEEFVCQVMADLTVPAAGSTHDLTTAESMSTETVHLLRNQFRNRFVVNRLTSTLLRCERSVLSSAESSSDCFEAAMGFLNLVQAQSNVREYACCVMVCAVFLTRAQLQCTDYNKKVVLYKCMVEQTLRSVAIGSHYSEPYLQLYLAQLAWRLLHVSRLDVCRTPTDFDCIQEFWSAETDQCGQLIAYVVGTAGRCCPISALSLRSSYLPSDILFPAIKVGRALLEEVLETARNNTHDALLPVHVVDGYRLEGAWKSWFVEADFQAIRTESMHSLLQTKTWSEQDVVNILTWPVIPRDADGWMLPTTHTLKLGPLTRGWFYNTVHEDVYRSIDGATVDLSTGEVKLSIQKATTEADSFLALEDVKTIFTGGIGQALFTLTAPEENLNYHPFQELRCYPANALAGTSVLMTLLHADYLLKMLSVGVEVSGVAPFATRPTSEGLLLRLPLALREVCKPVHARESAEASSAFANAHRFWIQPKGEVPVALFQNPTMLSCKVDAPVMEVRCQKMHRNEQGELVDDEGEGDLLSAEQRFAAELTANYDALAKYFPELARVKELARLCVVYRIVASALQSANDAVNNSATRRTHFLEVVNSLSDQLRGSVPYYSEAKVEARYADVLRENRVEAHRVSWTEQNKVKTQIRDNLRSNDQNQRAALVSSLSDVLPGENASLSSLVNAWYGDFSTHSTSTFANGLLELELKRSRNVIRGMSQFGVSLPCDDPVELLAPNAQRFCSWVPAAFLDTSSLPLDPANPTRRNIQVYGGVNLSARANVRNAASNPLGSTSNVSLNRASTASNPSATVNTNGTRGTVLPQATIRQNQAVFDQNRANAVMARMSQSANFSKVVGTAQNTGPRGAFDGGHAVESHRYVARAVQQPEVKAASMNVSYRTAIQHALGVQLPASVGNARPDATVYRETRCGQKIITVVEVPSKTDSPVKLYYKYKENAQQVTAALQAAGVHGVKFEYAQQQQTRGDMGVQNAQRQADRQG